MTGACVVVPSPGGADRLRVAAARGSLAQHRHREIRSDCPLVALADARDTDLSAPEAGHGVEPLSEVATLVAPLISDADHLETPVQAGALVVVRPPDTGPFDPADARMLTSFAAQAGVALHLAAARRDNERLQLLEDRERIAQDLSQKVIQRLFAVGMSIQAATTRITNTDLRQLIETQVEQLDTIITDIRSAVFALNETARSGPT